MATIMKSELHNLVNDLEFYFIEENKILKKEISNFNTHEFIDELVTLVEHLDSNDKEFVLHSHNEIELIETY